MQGLDGARHGSIRTPFSTVEEWRIGRINVYMEVGMVVFVLLSGRMEER